MKANHSTIKNQGCEDSTLQSNYALKFSKKNKQKKAGKSSKDKNNMFLETILEQLHLQNSSLSQLIFKW